MRNRVVAAVVAVAALAGAPAASADGQLIVGGSQASPGEYPYAVHLDGTLYACGGTLIAPEWVLTAGHCIYLYSPAGPTTVPAAHITATVGRDNLNDDGKGAQSRGVAAFVHPAYHARPLNPNFDVALIRLATPINNYQTIKIAGAGEEPTWAAGVKSTIIGWGATKEGDDGSDNLLEAEVPIVSDADCARAYTVVGPVSDFDATSMLCAGYLGRGGVDTCQGDSGGPLLVPTTLGYRQAGVTSWGYGCAEPDYPGVYARVGAPLLRDWVAKFVPSAIGTGAAPSGGTTNTKPGGGKKTRRKADRTRAGKRKRSKSARRVRAQRRAARG